MALKSICEKYAKEFTDQAIKMIAESLDVFSSSDDNYQNMLILNEVNITIPPYSEVQQKVAMACMNLLRDVPDSNVLFTLNIFNESDPLYQLLEILESENNSCAVIQAAVWIITDGFSEDNLHKAVSGISFTDYEKACEIVDSIIASASP